MKHASRLKGYRGTSSKAPLSPYFSVVNEKEEPFAPDVHTSNWVKWAAFAGILSLLQTRPARALDGNTPFRYTEKPPLSGEIPRQ